MGANVEFVREMLGIFNRSGGERAVEFALAPDVVWHSAPGWPGKERYEGVDGALELIDEWTGSFDEYEWHVNHAYDLGDRVLTLVHHRGRVGETWVERAMAGLWRIAGGRVAEAWFWFSWEEALAATGVDQSIESAS